MKRLLLLTCLPFIVTSAKAYFIPQTLYSMILNAERIVYGEVISIDSNTFTIKIEFSLTDPDNSLTNEPELLTIQKFQDYACAGRWSNYEKHQRLFLFLHNYKGQLKVMGSGNEGEILILQDSIMISGITLPSCPPDGLNEKQLRNWPNKECFDLRHYKVEEKQFYGYKTSLKSFIETVSSVRNCFKIETQNEYQIKSAKLNCDSTIVDKKILNDKIFRWTYRQLIK